jgi:hypothetical protein
MAFGGLFADPGGRNRPPQRLSNRGTCALVWVSSSGGVFYPPLFSVRLSIFLRSRPSGDHRLPLQILTASRKHGIRERMLDWLSATPASFTAPPKSLRTTATSAFRAIRHRCRDAFQRAPGEWVDRLGPQDRFLHAGSALCWCSTAPSTGTRRSPARRRVGRPGRTARPRTRSWDGPRLNRETLGEIIDRFASERSRDTFFALGQS